MCSKDMLHAEVANTVNYIANCGLSMDWRFGKEPYSRANPPPIVSHLPSSSISFAAEFDLSSLTIFVLNQNPLVPPSDDTAGPARQFVPDRAESDVDDPDLGAAAMESDAEGGGGEAGGSRPTTTFADWLDDDAEGEVAPHHRPGASQPGAGSSAAPGAPGGGKKHRAMPTLFGSRPRKPKGSAAATRRDEAVAKAIRFRKEVKKPPLVSA